MGMGEKSVAPKRSSLTVGMGDYGVWGARSTSPFDWEEWEQDAEPFTPG